MKWLGMMVVLLAMTACVQRPIHQGNELTKEKVAQVHIGDTKFFVEQTWGSPAIKDALHPNRMEYVQQVQDKDTQEHFVRGVIVEYDRALRVQSIKPFGFK